VKPISRSTVVITGASSGIGRAAALAFAELGASLVLAARRELLLSEVAAECHHLGGRALALPVDVADEGAVRELARRAAETFGGIDAWINNAGVGLFGRLDAAPMEVHKRVIETNLFGCMYGASAAMPSLAESKGVLVNNACRVEAPLATSYAAAVGGIRAFSAALRREARGQGVSVCTVLPGAVDTPFYEHAANYTGRRLVPLRPVSPEAVAKALVECVRRPRAEVFVGRRGVTEAWLTGEREQPETGNVLEPLHRGRGAAGHNPPAEAHSGSSRLAAVVLALTGVLLRR